VCPDGSTMGLAMIGLPPYPLTGGVGAGTGAGAGVDELSAAVNPTPLTTCPLS
jgi:hypothetical protein